MRKILIIDDDVTIGDLEQEVLERGGATLCSGPIPGRKRCFC